MDSASLNGLVLLDFIHFYRAIRFTSIFRSSFTLAFISCTENKSSSNKHKKTQEFILGKPQMGEKPNQPFLERFRPNKSNHEPTDKP
jgi:hypothetical protein